jgi:translocation and assembly module TamA
MPLLKYLIILSVTLPAILLANISYRVEFNGVKDEKVLDAIYKASSLIQEYKKPLSSVSAIHYRLDSDIVTIQKILRLYGYYDATISFEITTQGKKSILIQIYVSQGIRYTLDAYNIYVPPFKDKKSLPFKAKIPLEGIGIQLNQGTTTGRIVQAEYNLLDKLADLSYPLASVDKREIFVNTSKKTISVDQYIDPGPYCTFGTITIHGLKNINPQFIEKKIAWKENEPYNPQKVEETQKRLLNTQLFTSVLITHPDKTNPNTGNLPMKINCEESLHKNVCFGASYGTVEGFGGLFSYRNNNLFHMGETLVLDAQIAQRMYSGQLTFIKPDVIRLYQNYVCQFDVLTQNIYVCHYQDYGLAQRLDRRINDKIDFSMGIKAEYVNVTHSINNNKYVLLSTPLFLKYTTADQILNPTEGINLTYQPSFYLITNKSKTTFLKQKLSSAFYLPIFENKSLVLAFNFQFGSIASAPIQDIPIPKLFFGGSEDDLRGYKYKTVSPLNKQGRPIGGRSAIFFSFEPRIRLNNNFALVPFTDFGVVQTCTYPNPCGKWYKSVGLGLRYFTFFGPLKLDVGFPLNKRPFDPYCRVYVNIGQTF